MTTGGRLLRERDESGRAPVGYIELFFDLVYVFAITQLSHYLLGHLTARGSIETLILFLAVWWAWMFTTWATNWLDPDRAANRTMLGGIMIASLVMASALPQAFGRGGLVFACAYIGIQIGRTSYSAWAMRAGNPKNARNLTRATLWFGLSAPLWIGGALIDSSGVRLVCWSGALAVEYAGPFLRFALPGLGASLTMDWDISGAHMAERCALFIIIALGEGLLITGATFGALAPAVPTILAFVVAFAGSFAMWWVYFDIGAKRGAEHIEHHDDPGRVARNAFTYWHIPIVAGVIVMAVADELVLAHPADAARNDFVAVLVGGGVLFVGGTMVFKKISSGNPWYPLSHAVAIVLFAAIGLWGWTVHPTTLALSLAASASFALAALWEWVSFHGGWIEPMEARGWRIAGLLRARSERIVARRRAKEASRR